MTTLFATTVAAALFAGCASENALAWQTTRPIQGEAQGEQAAAGPSVARQQAVRVAAQDGSAKVAAPVPKRDGPHALPIRALPSGPPTYKYGAKFEPPDGRILHGMGQWAEGNKNYLGVVSDPALEPVLTTCFMNIGDWPRAWDSRSQALEKQMYDEVAQGRILHVSIALNGIEENGRVAKPIDTEIAVSDRYDDHIRFVARAVRNVGAPTFVRIGFEFSGSWNAYTPYVFPKAYRHVVDIFREEKVDNAAFVWCWEASCAGDFDEKGRDDWRWYPGDDYVDWFGLDLFNSNDFSGSAGAGRSARNSRYGNTLKFLAMAEEHKRPVMIAESGAVLVGITPDEEDGRRDWAMWFEPFFELMGKHPGIKAFVYCNSDWKNNGAAQAQGWKDGDISHNDYIARLYAETLRDPVFIHKKDLPLLRDWKPLPVHERPKEPAPTGPRRGRAAPGTSGG